MLDSEFTLKYKDGIVDYIKGKRTGVLDRTAMENAQLAYDKEPQKGQKPLFGQPQEKPKENVKPEPKQAFKGVPKGGF